MTKNKLTTSILTWVGLYPTLIIISFLFEDVLDGVPNYLRTFIITIIVVPLMIYIIMPWVNKIYIRFFN